MCIGEGHENSAWCGTGLRGGPFELEGTDGTDPNSWEEGGEEIIPSGWLRVDPWLIFALLLGSVGGKTGRTGRRGTDGLDENRADGEIEREGTDGKLLSMMPIRRIRAPSRNDR